MKSVFTLSNISTEFRYSINLALPLIVSEVIYAINKFITTIMVAHLGKEQLAANALVWGIYIALILFFIGIFCAVGILVAQSYGAKDNRSISICFKQGLILGITCAPLMMLSMWFAPHLLVWTKQDPTIINIAKPFFRSLIWTMLPFSIIVVMHQLLASTNKTKIVMITSMLEVPTTIFLCYVFLFGKFGMPKLGLAGIGYSSALCYWLFAIGILFYLHHAKDFKLYHLFHKWWVFNKKFFWELIRVGLPLGAMWCIEIALFVSAAMMMGHLGTTSLAAYQISDQYMMIALVIIFALTQTTSIRVGNTVGENNRDSLILTALVNLGIGLGFMSIFSIIYIGFPEFPISLDLDLHAPHLQSLIKEATKFLAIISILLLTDSLRLISMGALRGLKDTRFPILISIFGFWCVGFPCAYLLAFKFKFGGVGIIWGLVIGLFTSGIILFIRFNRLVKKIDLVKIVTKTDLT